jgi:asparagine synthase (glutamine-hydrolysing)
MCGIAGILSLTGGREAESDAIVRMTDCMAHRGPDADGFFSEPGISLGHRRLSIIDLSSSANQPFTDASGRYVIVYNGEVYNFQAVRQRLPGYEFKTNSDTEVILAAYMQWGASCLDHLNGMFAFAVWDRHGKTLFIARDRLGVKPLYYHLSRERFVFSSEIRAILDSGLVPRRLDRGALPDFFSNQSFGYPGSPVEGVRQLEAGTWLRIEGGALETRPYWRLGSRKEGEGFEDPEEVKKEVRRLLRDSVESRMVSDVPIGAFLSGGIDSSAVVGLMSEVSTRRPYTFNVSFEETEFDESAYARIVAEKFNTDHHTILLKPGIFLDQIESALDSMDTPSSDGPNVYVVSKAIRSAGITVALSGMGGDELFAGYPIFNQFVRMRKLAPLLSSLRPFRGMVSGILERSGSGRSHRMAKLLSLDSIDVSTVYPELRRILSPVTLRRLVNSQMPEMESLERNLKERLPELSRLPLLSQVTAAEMLGYTQNTLMKDADQMSMAVSLEVREPFFDYRLLEYVLQIPDTLKAPVYPKSLLVESLKPLLPDEIVFRRKKGFLLPWKDWMRREMKSYCEAKIFAMGERDFINRAELVAYWNRFLKGDPSIRWPEIWVFVVLEHWMQKNGVS